MNGYETIGQFCEDTSRLIAGGATLRDLYDALCSVRDTRGYGASPQQISRLAEVWNQRPVLAFIRLQELFGGLQVEHSDDYVLAMIGSLGGRHEQEIRLHFLRHDAELRDELFWRIFEVEGGGEISLANIDKFSREELNWHNTVVLLANEGTIDRGRVLRSCLEALNRDFSAYRAGWFSRVYAALKPTAAEAAADQDLLLLALGANVTATVSFATKQLAAVHKAGLLDSVAFIEACGPALAGTKSAALTAVKMLSELTSSGPDRIAISLALGLAHTHADVQRAVIKELDKLGRLDLAREQREGLNPSVAAELLPGTEPPVQEPEPAVESHLEPFRLVPWTDADALERFSLLLENGSDALGTELALAWFATAPQPGAVLAPLAKRLAKVSTESDAIWIAKLALVAIDPSQEYLPQERHQMTVTTMVNGAPFSMPLGEPKLQPAEEELTVLPSLVTRMREVASILRGSEARRELLATPTDSLGRIDAETFARRYRARPDGSGAVFPADLTQALLRISPSERAPLLAEFDLDMPPVTDSVVIDWQRTDSDSLKANGTPQWTWWWPAVRGDLAEGPSPINPALIASRERGFYGATFGTTDLTTYGLGLARPDATLPLTAVGIGIVSNAIHESSEHRATAVLNALSRHPGNWTAETAQLVALGLAAKRSDIRSIAAEVFASAIPARLPLNAAAEGFAACVPAVVLNRWAESFADAASLAPAAVIDLLTLLLPRIDRKARGLGALMSVLLDECLRHGRQPTDSVFAGWLQGFTGSSATAKTAKSLAQLT